MNATNELLDRLAAKLGDATYRRIAASLEVSRTAIYRWRLGSATLSDDNALKVAELLGEDPRKILLLVLIERSSNTKVKQVLRQIAAQFKSTASDE